MLPNPVIRAALVETIQAERLARAAQSARLDAPERARRSRARLSALRLRVATRRLAPLTSR
jgi:hypothetical protein